MKYFCLFLSAVFFAVSLSAKDDIVNFTESNRLKYEKSPYLLQHADNPVNWYLWGQKAFQRAELENKPIFLSIGYSTCHWCHVMEKESFEDETVAKLLNDNFICIKVDREEHPEIDALYMNACQAMTNSGGWPLTIVMTPDKKPFFAATYIPKTSRFGHQGLLELLPSIAKAWKNGRDEIANSADKIIEYLKHAPAKTADSFSKQEISDLFIKAYTQIKNSYDSENGGFASAPKFPSPAKLTFLMRYYYLTRDKYVLTMLEKTLLKMRAGGIYDQVGLGFHRYATDSRWLIPHFEKMLYDQALLSDVYREFYQLTGKSEFKNTTEEIISFVLTNMNSPEGGFYTALDADSEGDEGKFYLWKKGELKQILNEDEFTLLNQYFNILDNGNFISPLTGKTDGNNILFLREDVDLNQKELYPILKKLNQYRNKRVHPFTDKKILCSWNALMIAALADAGIAMHNSSYIKTAEKTAQFISDKMMKNNKLFHSYIDSSLTENGTLDDYAFFVRALIKLYEATFKIKYLDLALRLEKTLDADFYDTQIGAYFIVPEDNIAELPARSMEFYDTPIPSGNSVQMMNLIKLYHFTGRNDFILKAQKIFNAASGILRTSPSSCPALLSAMLFEESKPLDITLVPGKDNNMKKFLNTINSFYIPEKIIIKKVTLPEKNNFLKKTADIFKNSEHKSVDNKTTVYVCENKSCFPPVTLLQKFEKLLKKITESGEK
jgi:uncharacterized protein YyaL (SSP411 family)